MDRLETNRYGLALALNTIRDEKTGCYIVPGHSDNEVFIIGADNKCQCEYHRRGNRHCTHLEAVRVVKLLSEQFSFNSVMFTVVPAIGASLASDASFQ